MSELGNNLIAIASIVKGKRKKSINAPALANGGQLAPAKLPIDDDEEPEEKCACGKSVEQIKTCKKGADCSMKMSAKAQDPIFFPISKASDEEQTVTGIVLAPEVVDAQGDIYDAGVIKEAAYKFLANYNKATKLGKQHKDFASWQNRFALVESYLAPMDFVLGNNVVKGGSWVMTVKVLDKKIWNLVKTGKITGFSIGGKAKVQNLSPQAT